MVLLISHIFYVAPQLTAHSKHMVMKPPRYATDTHLLS